MRFLAFHLDLQPGNTIKMTHDSLIFDLDGTLWNATEVYLQTWNESLPACGIDRQLNLQQVMDVMGLEYPVALARLFPDIELQDPKGLLLAVEESQKKLLNTAPVSFYPGVQSGIPSLAESYRIFLVSNCDAFTIPVFLDRSGLKTYFEGWLAFGDTHQKKWQNIQSIVEKYKLNSPCYIGDTASDQEEARLSQVPFYQVTYGFGKPLEEVKQFPSFRDLQNYFLK